jgi:hypothetical protein
VSSRATATRSSSPTSTSCPSTVPRPARHAQPRRPTCQIPRLLPEVSTSPPRPSSDSVPIAAAWTDDLSCHCKRVSLRSWRRALRPPGVDWSSRSSASPTARAHLGHGPSSALAVSVTRTVKPNTVVVELSDVFHDYDVTGLNLGLTDLDLGSGFFHF